MVSTTSVPPVPGGEMVPIKINLRSWIRANPTVGAAQSFQFFDSLKSREK